MLWLDRVLYLHQRECISCLLHDVGPESMNSPIIFVRIPLVEIHNPEVKFRIYDDIGGLDIDSGTGDVLSDRLQDICKTPIRSESVTTFFSVDKG